ncbi:MAG: hypothetical protein Q9170_001610 [Blastenia crenularia]
MKFFSIISIALATSLLSSTFASPTPVDNALVERVPKSGAAPAALVIVNQLFVDVQKDTAVINSTAATLTKSSTPKQKTTAGKTFKSAIASINTLVVKATSSIKALPATPATKRALEDVEAIIKRQAAPADPTGLAGELSTVILEIGGALNQIIATLGLTATLSFLGPLVGSLSLLIASLIPVVDNLLILVGAILDGVLGGLSLALAGLVM